MPKFFRDISPGTVGSILLTFILVNVIILGPVSVADKPDPTLTCGGYVLCHNMCGYWLECDCEEEDGSRCCCTLV